MPLPCMVSVWSVDRVVRVGSGGTKAGANVEGTAWVGPAGGRMCGDLHSVRFASADGRTSWQRRINRKGHIAHSSDSR